MSWIPKASPHFQEPRHLTALVQIFEAIRAGKAGLRIAIHAPPQHGKTELIIHALNWLMRSTPDQRHAYATYAQHRSTRVSDLCRKVADRSGAGASGTKSFWGSNGNNVLWTSVGGPFTGEPVTHSGLLIIDDPNSDRAHAESPTIQAKQRDWLSDVADARCHPGASIIINATRWCEADLAGYAIKELGFEYICLPALNADDEPLWPEERPFDFLDKKRQANAYTWASLYQGRPSPRGKAVFQSSTTYTELPPNGRRTGYGLDCAYTAKTRADWSVLIKGVKVDDVLYITGVWREQLPIEQFKVVLLDNTRVGSDIRWYVAGQEKAIAGLLRPDLPGRRLMVKPATTDKLQRALPASEAWNMGKIQVPENAPWLEDLLSEVGGFTGVKDFHDDIVDALAALWDLLNVHAVMYDDEMKALQKSMPKARASF